MFTEGGDDEEAGIKLAGQQVTGKPQSVRLLPGKKSWNAEWPVYEDGFFSYTGTRSYWLACLRRLPGGTVGTTRSWRIFAPTPENLDNDDCEQIKLVVTSVADRKQGAYKYE